jgi:hypothetical protein
MLIILQALPFDGAFLDLPRDKVMEAPWVEDVQAAHHWPAVYALPNTKLLHQRLSLRSLLATMQHRNAFERKQHHITATYYWFGLWLHAPDVQVMHRRHGIYAVVLAATIREALKLNELSSSLLMRIAASSWSELTLLTLESSSQRGIVGSLGDENQQKKKKRRRSQVGASRSTSNASTHLRASSSASSSCCFCFSYSCSWHHTTTFSLATPLPRLLAPYKTFQNHGWRW